MNKIENYFLQQNKIKFSNVVCSQHNKKIILRNLKKAVKAVKKEKKDINDKGIESMKEIHNEELKKIYSEVEKCMKCEALCNSRLNVVFGRGDEEPDIVFVGEAPGADEDKQGLPFVGRGGKLLDKWIERMNINNKKYYIMNALKCRPPENRVPTDFEKQPILEETKIILAILFKDYWATPDQKEKIKLKEKYDDIQEELIKRERYNPDNLFIKSAKQEKITEYAKTDELPMVKYKESLFKKIWYKISNKLKK